VGGRGVSRAYLRLDPNLPDHKGDYPDGAGFAFVLTLCLAEQQPKRGRFKSDRLLKVLLERRGRWVPWLVEHGDLIRNEDGELYVDGWDQWQEGDLRVAERMALVRGSKEPPEGLKRPGAIRVERHRLRTHIFERDAYTCRYCGNGRYPRDWLVLEHVDPNGPSDDGNLVTACRPCNKLKGGRTPEDAGMTLLPISNALLTQVVTRSTVKAEAVGGKPLANSGGIAPANGATDSPSAKTRDELIEEQRRLLSHPHPAIAHAAEKALRKLGAA